MKHLDTIQRAYVIRCFASYLPIPKTVDYFMDMFPSFGAHMGKETLKNRLTERFKKIKQKHAKEILAVREKHPYAYWHIPMAHRHVRILALIELFELQIPGTTPDPRIKLKILKSIDTEVEHLKNDIPDELYEALQCSVTESLIDLLNKKNDP